MAEPIELPEYATRLPPLFQLELYGNAYIRPPAEVTVDEWIEQVRAWAASFPQVDTPVDDSRGSIYGE